MSVLWGGCLSFCSSCLCTPWGCNMLLLLYLQLKGKMRKCCVPWPQDAASPLGQTRSVLSTTYYYYPGISGDHCPGIKMCCLRKHSIPAWCEATVLPGIHSFLTEAFADFTSKNNPSLLIVGFNLPHPCREISSGCHWEVKETSRNKDTIKYK